MDRLTLMRTWFAATDGLLALALFVVPLFLDSDGCGGFLIVLASWIGAGLAAISAIAFLVPAKSSHVLPLLIGVAGTLGAGWIAVDVLQSHWTADYWVAILLVGPASVQLPFGLMVRRTLRLSATTSQ
jgi:hypothetical protein